jgi:hypothetical protein
MPTEDIFDLVKKLVIVLISSQCCLSAYFGLSAIAQTQTSARQNITNTAVDLRHIYYPGKASSPSAFRNQQEWASLYRQKQQRQRMQNWQDRREAIEYQKNMANPRSPQAMVARKVALRAQALQAKLPPEQRTKIPLYPIMTPAKSLSQIYAASPSSRSTKQLPVKQGSN